MSDKALHSCRALFFGFFDWLNRARQHRRRRPAEPRRGGMRSDDMAKDRESAVVAPRTAERLRTKAKGSRKSDSGRTKAARRRAESKIGGARRPYPRATLEEALRVP